MQGLGVSGPDTIVVMVPIHQGLTHQIFYLLQRIHLLNRVHILILHLYLGRGKIHIWIELRWLWVIK